MPRVLHHAAAILVAGIVACCSLPHGSQTVAPPATVPSSTIPGHYANVYPDVPDPKLTPGATRSTDLATIIATETQAEAERPTQAVKDQVYREYGIDPKQHEPCEIDHLIPLSIGGANDLRNYWPELYVNRPGHPGASIKDRVEDKLYLLTRAKANPVPIPVAQHAISTDWKAAYVQYIGPMPAYD